MTRLTVDAATLARLGGASSLVEVCDDAGHLLGYFLPVTRNGETPRSPFSDEEIQRRRQQKTGHSLAEVLRTLSRP
jgi:hypothetical protein